ncbi:esterase family protein [Dyadobacter sandarakinus]|uniref:Esterase family protein n=1 Tax=Dyadobacter sandarakinus TaxID=2747268 RepID=A0ABX7I399_9BACT|nr:alpha/beta hydrolase-fold protein [Dyadobacter sandarakinus]QRR00557.1 esterase family protein [Dyadobacter sandarakinus]
MNRAYLQSASTVLGKCMELLIFGDRGNPVIFFPTRMARFFDMENWRVIEAMRPRIEAGEIQVFCVDSNDSESFYSDREPAERIRQHMLYERYILEEVIPMIRTHNQTPGLIAAGCSLGGYHAVNIAFRHPDLFVKVVGMSARYDLTRALEYFPDVFDGYYDENIYFHTPNHYIPRLSEPGIISLLQQMDIILAVGEEDAFLENNIELSHALNDIGVSHQLFIWGEEAHRPRFWREMVKLYI